VPDKNHGLEDLPTQFSQACGVPRMSYDFPDEPQIEKTQWRWSKPLAGEKRGWIVGFGNPQLGSRVWTLEKLSSQRFV
jgi:hypothetical protein